jgi:hypothetical protein
VGSRIDEVNYFFQFTSGHKASELTTTVCTLIRSRMDKIESVMKQRFHEHLSFVVMRRYQYLLLRAEIRNMLYQWNKRRVVEPLSVIRVRAIACPM